EPGVALYAPLRLAVYEDGEGKCVVAYDRFTSLLAQYQHPEIASTAKVVEQKVDALIAEVTGEERRTHEPDSQSTAATGVATGRVTNETQRPAELKPLDVLIGRWLTEGETVAGHDRRHVADHGLADGEKGIRRKRKNRSAKAEPRSPEHTGNQ